MKTIKLLSKILFLIFIGIISCSDAKDYNKQGLEKANSDNFKEAISLYTKAIEIDQNYAEAYNNRGEMYGKLEDFPKAITDFNKAIELDPGLSKAYCNRGEIYIDS